MSRHLVTLATPEWTRERILDLIASAAAIKADPQAYRSRLDGRTLLMLFAKPSLRTRVSFEIGMTQLGGHAIFYSTASSPFGKKETIADTARVISRYADIMLARLFAHADLEALAANSTIPVINALTDFAHPVQALADLLTLREHSATTPPVLAYLGDGNNNVTHSLLYACTRVGIDIRVACPADPDFTPQPAVIANAQRFATAAGSRMLITDDVDTAVAGATAIYTDSWMSYHIPAELAAARRAKLAPFQVTHRVMTRAAPGAVFMNCLPAERGAEQTADVIDGPHSIVFDQAENRLHLQKALMLELLGA
jgi:ornithine carbamoyltransferase